MLQNRNIWTAILIFTLSAGLMTGCDPSTGGNNTAPGEVTLQFTTGSSGSSFAKAKTSTFGQLQSTHDSLALDGSNGTLNIHDLRFIVEDFELEKAEGACEETEGTEENEECEEFESEPFFVDLPLLGDTLDLSTAAVEPGLYEELEFEVDDLDLEEEEEEEQGAKEQLAGQIRGEFPDWPDEASMVILGEFISNEGDTTAFKTYAEAEIEIEMEFNPPLEVGENTVGKLLRVEISPDSWFLKSDGTVIDLSAYDYETTGTVIEFEVEMEHGFEGVQVDDDDDEESDDD